MQANTNIISIDIGTSGNMAFFVSAGHPLTSAIPILFTSNRNAAQGKDTSDIFIQFRNDTDEDVNALTSVKGRILNDGQRRIDLTIPRGDHPSAPLPNDAFKGYQSLSFPVEIAGGVKELTSPLIAFFSQWRNTLYEPGTLLDFPALPTVPARFVGTELGPDKIEADRIEISLSFLFIQTMAKYFFAALQELQAAEGGVAISHAGIVLVLTIPCTSTTLHMKWLEQCVREFSPDVVIKFVFEPFAAGAAILSQNDEKFRAIPAVSYDDFIRRQDFLVLDGGAESTDYVAVGGENMGALIVEPCLDLLEQRTAPAYELTPYSASCLNTGSGDAEELALLFVKGELRSILAAIIAEDKLPYPATTEIDFSTEYLLRGNLKAAKEAIGRQTTGTALADSYELVGIKKIRLITGKNAIAAKITPARIEEVVQRRTAEYAAHVADPAKEAPEDIKTIRRLFPSLDVYPLSLDNMVFRLRREVIQKYLMQVIKSVIGQFVAYLKQQAYLKQPKPRIGIIALVGGLLGSEMARSQIQAGLDSAFGSGKFANIIPAKTNTYEAVAKGGCFLAHLPQYEGDGFDVQHICILPGFDPNKSFALALERSKAEYDADPSVTANTSADSNAPSESAKQAAFYGTVLRAAQIAGGALNGKPLVVTPNTPFGFVIHLLQYTGDLDSVPKDSADSAILRVEVHLKDLWLKDWDMTHPGTPMPAIGQAQMLRWFQQTYEVSLTVDEASMTKAKAGRMGLKLSHLNVHVHPVGNRGLFIDYSTRTGKYKG